MKNFKCILKSNMIKIIILENHVDVAEDIWGIYLECLKGKHPEEHQVQLCILQLVFQKKL